MSNPRSQPALLSRVCRTRMRTDIERSSPDADLSESVIGEVYLLNARVRQQPLTYDEAPSRVDGVAFEPERLRGNMIPGKALKSHATELRIGDGVEIVSE